MIGEFWQIFIIFQSIQIETKSNTRCVETIIHCKYNFKQFFWQDLSLRYKTNPENRFTILVPVQDSKRVHKTGTDKQHCFEQKHEKELNQSWVFWCQTKYHMNMIICAWHFRGLFVIISKPQTKSCCFWRISALCLRILIELER